MAISKATASSIAPAAKGDLVAGSATNDAAVLAVGAMTQYLLLIVLRQLDLSGLLLLVVV
jgi:hypothetical protein